MTRIVIGLVAGALLATAAGIVQAGQGLGLDRLAQWWRSTPQASAAEPEFISAEDRLEAGEKAARGTRRTLVKSLSDAKRAAEERDQQAALNKKLLDDKEAEDQLIETASVQLRQGWPASSSKAVEAKPASLPKPADERQSTWLKAGKLPVVTLERCRTVLSYRPVEWQPETDGLRYGDSHEPLIDPAVIASIVWSDWRRSR
jgi:hypothetical protein